MNNNDITVEEYLKFMTNEDNLYNCKNCPENVNANERTNSYVQPCGQQCCWVAAHLGYYNNN